ncbi:exodeoxyribonuclease I [Buchnera aphidicola (Periphyllus koelreuteriae)]|uniref:exodeoxyribonuclease I n=1 Tax=Buchnera aphidicola TaxID=9 RepID=UPI0031B849DF
MKNTFPFNFLFYDYETFGTNPILDKPSQFACIRTDFNFNIINKPIILYCYPPIDYLPNPESVLITSITPQYTRKYGLNESNFSKKIYNILNLPNTCIIGYNNIAFDDEITRNIFYRNFFDSYEWSWKNNNTRWDVLSLVRAFYSLRPKGINWNNSNLHPISLKLSNLTKLNNIDHYKSHDALSDVYSTLNLLRLLKQTNIKFFNFLFFIRKKKNILKLITKNFFEPLIYISSYFGSEKNYFGRILPLIIHKKNKNILIAFDLDNDYFFDDFKNKNFIENFNLKNLFSIGIRFIYLNKFPVLIPLNVLRKKDIIRLKLNQKRFLENLFFFKKYFNFKIINKLSKIKFKKKIYKHVDNKLYESFFSYFDKKKIYFFRQLINKNIIQDDFKIFDNRFSDLLFFFQARNFENTLSKINQYRWKKYLLKFFSSKKIFLYKEKIFSLKKKYYKDKKKTYLLKELLLYLKFLIKIIKKK